MNEKRSFERLVVDNVADVVGGVPLPEDFYEDMHTYASHTRQRPEWLALTKEPPMRISGTIAVGSPTFRVAAILAATLLLAVSLVAAGIAGGTLLAADRVLVVDASGGGDYLTITEAVAAAVDGDTVRVKPGTYVEAVTIAHDFARR
jgi:hypothetical protein